MSRRTVTLGALVLFVALSVVMTWPQARVMATHVHDSDDRLRQPEVEHLHGAVRPHLDVRGLQVAVDHALPVRSLERLGNLLRDWQRLVEWNSPPREPLRMIESSGPARRMPFRNCGTAASKWR